MADDDFLINTLGSGQQGGSSSGMYQGSSFYGEFESSPLGSRDGPTSYGNTPSRGSSRTPGKPPRKSILDSGRRYVEITDKISSYSFNGLPDHLTFFSLNYSYINWKI